MRMAGIGREAWLRTLDKERGISPVQYARDIIYPGPGAAQARGRPRCRSPTEDLKKAFEAQYGDKLRCRLIMVDKLHTAQEIWEELRKNPGGFEKLAQERSMDCGSRSLGGLLAEPITRHAYPAERLRRRLPPTRRRRPERQGPRHKPKDGDFTGPIQVAEATWVILKPRGRDPRPAGVDPNERARSASRSTT